MEPTAIASEFIQPPPMARPEESRFAEDAKLHVEFHRMPVIHPHKSQAAGRAIYEGLHASNGVFWHAVKEKHVWRGLAFNALTAALSEATP